MTSKILQILVLAVTLPATPTGQARETIEASNRQMQVRNDYDQFNNWGSWTRPPTTKVYTTVQYAPTTKVHTTIQYTPTALPSVWSTQSVPRISRKRASSILTPTEYCDMDFQEMRKISSQDSICNTRIVSLKENSGRNYYGFPFFPSYHRYFRKDLQALVKKQCGDWCRYQTRHPDCGWAPGHSLYQAAFRSLSEFMRIARRSGLHQECSYEGCTFREVIENGFCIKDW